MTHRKVKHLTHPPPDSKADTYEDWLVDDAAIVSWLVNSMDPSVAREVMMLRSAKKIWDTLRLTYDHEKNISRVFEINEQLFTLCQGDQSIHEHFTALRGVLDEFDIYQPLTIDIT